MPQAEALAQPSTMASVTKGPTLVALHVLIIFCQGPTVHFASCSVQEDKPGFLSLIQDMLRPESLPEGWTAEFDPESGVYVTMLSQSYCHAVVG
jgi:hypothetical protein